MEPSRKRLLVRASIILLVVVLIAVIVNWDRVRDAILSLIYPDAGQIAEAEFELPPLESLEAAGEIMPVVVQSIVLEDPDDPRTLLFQYDTSSYEGSRLVVSSALGIGHVGVFTSVIASGSEPVMWDRDLVKRIDWSGSVVLLYHATDDPDVGVNVYRIILSQPLLP